MHARTIGLAALIAGYGLSQFYRAFLAVLAPALQAELGAGPGDLAVASGLWFLTFALMQLPIGWALDAVGPRRTASVLLAVGAGGGAILFATAREVWHMQAAMALIGVGCAPVLMAAYYMLARLWEPAAFGALAGATVGFGSLGNIAGAAPLVAAAEAFGWRQTMGGLAATTFAVAALIALTVRDPAPARGQGTVLGALGRLMRIRALWWLLPLVFAAYAPSAAIRGLWAGPYLQQVHGASAAVIGNAALVMGLAMIVGNLAVGGFTRLAGGPRRASIIGGATTLAALGALAAAPAAPLPVAIALLAVVGLSGTNYALLMAEGRRFMPTELVGYGITALNMASIAGVGAMQFASRPVFRIAAEAGDPAATFRAVFLFFAAPLAIGFAAFLLAPRNARA